jgi:hypothetical protein
MGSITSTMLTTILYRGFLSGLTEQVRALKAKGIFDKTVLHISSEFNRCPLKDGSGSDHGWFGSNATLISGMIKHMSVVGNVQKASYSKDYAGTFGVGAPFVMAGENFPLRVNDVALTVTSMLGAAPVITNGRALLAPHSSTDWRPVKEEAKNV